MAKEFNTIAVDDGIAMGHGGMLYSLPRRTIVLDVDDAELAKRRVEEEGHGPDAWRARGRERVVSTALWAYAALTTSADRGAVRDLSQLKR